MREPTVILRGDFDAHDIALAIAARLAVELGIPREAATDRYRNHLDRALQAETVPGQMTPTPPSADAAERTQEGPMSEPRRLPITTHIVHIWRGPGRLAPHIVRYGGEPVTAPQPVAVDDEVIGRCRCTRRVGRDRYYEATSTDGALAGFGESYRAAVCALAEGVLLARIAAAVETHADELVDAVVSAA